MIWNNYTGLDILETGLDILEIADFSFGLELLINHSIDQLIPQD